MHSNFRIFRSNNQRSMFAIFSTDSDENPIEMLHDQLTFEQAQELFEQITK